MSEKLSDKLYEECSKELYDSIEKNAELEHHLAEVEEERDALREECFGFSFLKRWHKEGVSYCESHCCKTERDLCLMEERKRVEIEGHMCSSGARH